MSQSVSLVTQPLLRRANIFSGIVFVAAILGYVSTVLASVDSVLQAQDLLVISYLMFAAVSHLVWGTFGWSLYVSHVRQKVLPSRWIEYSLTASLMMLVIAMSVDITNPFVLTSLFILTASMCLTGLFIERQFVASKQYWYPLSLGGTIGIVPWLLILFSVLTGESYGAGHLIVLAVIFLLFSLFAVNTTLYFRQYKRWENYSFVELMYQVLSVTSKLILAAGVLYVL